jgi:hypothetical protein
MGNRAPATVTTFAPRGQAKSTSIVALAPCVWIRVVGVGDQAELILLLLVSLRSVWLTPLFLGRVVASPGRSQASNGLRGE